MSRQIFDKSVFVGYLSEYHSTGVVTHKANRLPDINHKFSKRGNVNPICIVG